MSGGIFHTRGARASTQAIENYRFRQRLIPVSLLLGVSLTLASVFLLAPTSSAQDPVTTRIECSDATDDFVLLCLAFEAVFNNFVDGVVVVDLADAAKQGVIDANLAERTTDAPPCALPAPEFEDMCAEIDKAEDTTAAAVAATDAMLASLNEARTRRLTPDQHRSFDNILSSEITRIGIGIEFALLDTDGNPCRTPSDTCRMQILEVYSPSPAETAGLMVGDVIVAYGKVVADNPCRDLRSLDYGHDLGDTVSVSILRNGTAMDFDLVTAEVIDPVVFSQIVDGNVGYIQLDVFSSGSPEKFLAHLTRLINAGAKAIVVDLRNNPGGYLTETGLISAAFLNDGDLVYRIVSVHSDQSANAGGDGIAADAIALPMAVAVNGRSASGSELFALALRGNSRAKIVGRSTFGKHTGQKTFTAEASDGTSLGAILVTSLRFFGPGDLSSAGGIQPDFVESISGCAHPIGVVRQSVPSLYPRVSDLSITSVPASVAYTPGEKVTVAVSFDAPVSVDTANGTPYLELQVGTEVRQAVYQSTLTNNGISVVDFEYTVANDTDDDGISIEQDSIILNGATIRRRGAGWDAILDHPRLAAEIQHAVIPDPVIPDPVIPDPVIPDPVIPDPVIPDPVIPDPVIPDPVIPDPVIPDPVIPDPVIPDPVIPDPVIPDPVTPDPVTPDPVTPDPVIPDPVIPDPVTPEPEPIEPEPIEPEQIEPEPTPDPAPDPVELEPEQIFSDISHTLFVEHIYWLAAQGITTGCGPTTFCPDESVTRGQMAAFLNRALQLPAADQDYFTDDNGSTFEDDINRLRQAGITTGCGPTTSCWDQPTTRGQMAAFLNRALQLPAADQDYFTDDNGSTFEDDINRLRQAGITTGCGPTTSCWDQPTTRGQMAAFLYRARDLIEAARQQNL